MKKKRIIQFCLFALMLGLSVFIFANKTLAADKHNTNNNTTVSENTIDPIKATSVAFLQSGKSNTVAKNASNMPIFPVSQKLVKSGVTDPYLNAYTNYDDKGNALPTDSQDLVMESDGSGGYTAYVYNAKGFVEAIFDPACSSNLTSSENYAIEHVNEAGWNDNCTDKGGSNNWKTIAKDPSKRLWSTMLSTVQTNLPVSKIHKIVFQNNIDMTNADSETVKNYYLNIPDADGIGHGGNHDWQNVNIRHDDLIIDGKSTDGTRHWLNMGYNNWALRGNNYGATHQPFNHPYKENWTLENMDCYGSSYYGIVSCNTGIATNYLRAHSKVNDPDPDDNTPLTADKISRANVGLDGGYTWVTYKDITYTGSQFSWTDTNHVAGTTMKGNIISRSLYSYKAPGINPDFVWQTDSNGNQQIFQEDRIIFDKTCRFTGSTYNGNALELTGNATLEDGAIVNIYPHGTSGEDSHDGLNHGLYFTNSGSGSLLLKGKSKLNIHCDDHDGNDLIQADGTYTPSMDSNSSHTIFARPVGALDMASSNSRIKYQSVGSNSPEINIDSDGPIYGNNALLNFGGGTADLADGKFSINARNLNKIINGKVVDYKSGNNNGLMKVGSGAFINVKTGGDFSIAAHNSKNLIDDQGNTVTDDDAATSPVNLLYSSGSMNINIMNPKNVSLDLTDHQCPDSTLVYTRSDANIKAFDTRIQAEGDNNLSNGNKVGVNASGNNSSIPPNILGQLGITYAAGQTISIGKGKDKDPNGGFCTSSPIRVQTLTLPFNGPAIDFFQYLSKPADVPIQAPENDLNNLKKAMIQMNGREFRYVRLSDLPGPTEDAVDKVGVPGASKISQKDITGQVGGDYWANDDESDNTLFSPVPPLLRVQLLHKGDKSAIDLGTVYNKDAAKQKAKESDAMDSSVTEVTPNSIDNDRNVRTDDKGNYIIGKKITTGGDTSNPQPKYLDSSIVKWDNGSWSKDTSSSENDPQHSFSYNLQDVLDKYNDNHTDKKISFKPGDQVLTSVVTNYQETPVQNTRITNLYLQKGKEPKTPFLVGDKINMPFQYIDTIDNASPLHIKGAIYKLDDNGNKTLVTSFERDDIPIKKTSGWLNSSLNLPTEPTSKPGATSEPGNYVVEFYGTDDVGNAGPDDPISWKYTVSNLPKYNGKKVLNDHTTGDTTKPGNIVSNLHYTVKTIFEAVNTTNGTLSEVKFNHPDNSDINIEDNSDYTLTASYDDKGQTINKPLNSGFEYGKYYEPKKFGIKNTDNFPAGVKFTITHKILVKKKAKDDPDKLVQIGADQMYSKEGNDGEDILLGTSNSIKYNSVGFIVLNVGKSIDYGTNPVAVPLKKERVFFIPKTQDPKVSVTNNTPYSQPIILTAQVDGDTSGLNNWLYYRKTEGNADDSDTLMTNKVTVFHDSVGTNVPQNISSSWFNPKTGEQVTGPILKLGQNSSPTPGKYSTKITWNLTNSL
ncbi:hypothetical protein [Bombilactobacillus mellis]|uniref:hypothetical protein n=1 Tax=Bombilactobacillus mellis TaxID=1218508 RepID=UPI0015813045|nr:hypothetical protein [Bombilactobacillus mellis]NUF24959.1 hypothetical protein [Bombilactobacillus mellis]